MAWKRNLAEFGIWLFSLTKPASRNVPENPKSIFILRNNDIGDLMVITPLFEALRKRFPNAEIVAGIGSWNVDILKNNPFVSRIMVVNAPWQNKVLPNQTYTSGFKYALFSKDVAALRACHFDIGIDIVGSFPGAVLLMQARIPFRMGVKGYGGGYSTMQRHYQFADGVHVGRAALKNAELLGLPTADLPENRPQIYLSPDEVQFGEQLWRQVTGNDSNTTRILISPGGGSPERVWPTEHYRTLVQRLLKETNARIIVTGGKRELEMLESFAALSDQGHCLASSTSLRQVFAVTSRCDMVISNTSMQSHAAAAFRKPTLVLLSDFKYFPSAKRHDLTWGYPEQIHLGKEPERPVIATPEEAFDAALALQQKVNKKKPD